MTKDRSSVGDVFSIPTGDGRVAIGQLTAKTGRLFFISVFDHVIAEGELQAEADVAIDSALSSPVVLMGLSMHTRIASGHWTYLGERPVAAAHLLPAFKETIGGDGTWHVVDWSGDRRKPASELEVASLPFRKVLAPAWFDLGLKAHLGLTDWREELDALKTHHGPRSADIFASS